MMVEDSTAAVAFRAVVGILVDVTIADEAVLREDRG